MANSEGPSSFRSMMHNGKHSLLPPKSPFPSISPSYVDYVPLPAIGAKAFPKPRDVSSQHQRTSSESVLIEDQPSWLDDLLSEPAMPVGRGHRRSSSDSFAYVDAANAANLDYAAHDEYRSRSISSLHSWKSQELDYCKDAHNAYAKPNSFGKYKNRAWDSPSNVMSHPSGLFHAKDNFVPRHSVSSCASDESNRFLNNATEKLVLTESGLHDTKTSLERKDSSYAKTSSPETDTKRAKQQFAQRSRVRKLQYIAELERNVQALQAEGSEVSAEIEFLNQQNLILSMENKALKQRLENLTQEQLIKYLEHEVLEREIGRLRTLYQQHQQPSLGHRRAKSRDLDSQFASLSLKHKDSSPGTDAISGPLHS
ncbi:hypothetical protein AG4045_010491 [Apium graveolens]|uniref:BZIP domain-containing protein n=1 Tax=Apium graveolens TaxID=4045 RepID=A0A6L5BA77_APIGR|nr:hypothetical protein AG4045_010491 [Apium graveolens]